MDIPKAFQSQGCVGATGLSDMSYQGGAVLFHEPRSRKGVFSRGVIQCSESWE